VGIFLGIENAEIDDFFIDADLSSPFTSLFHPANASKAGCVVALSSNIFGVDLLRRVSEVSDSVVVADPIYVVDNTSRPLPIVEKPRNAVGKVPAAVDIKIQVPLNRMLEPGNIANLNGSGKADLSGDDSGFRVVIKKFSGALGQNVGFHANNSSMEAARADEQRAGLDACYRHIDTAMK